MLNSESYHTMIGPNAERYIRSFERSRKPHLFAGWNTAAFFAAPFWSASRHLYGAVLFYAAFLTAAAFVESFLPAWLGLSGAFVRTPLLVAVPFVFVHLLFGVFGNAWFYRALEKKKYHPSNAPIFRMSGRSMRAALIAPAAAFLLAAWPLITLLEWQYNPPVESGVYVYDEERTPTPEGMLDVMDDPVFEKYSGSVNLFYAGPSLEGKTLSYELFYRSGTDTEPVRTFEVSLFSTGRLSLDLLDLADPELDTGEYELLVYLDDTLYDTTSFYVNPPAS
ncbi:hypothetical protein [Alkalicoccus urumqiensis]|uniref:DUF2628 domain-containing protein n=1 Tax=Alkalicoccus urumqiensis TaxID=1548213 RepID=A0A2P6MHZ7_ALKUR|nr:hypothetical protein [Alkalicoccus urumqiensis]PRO65914.1 hypothetical protein C6I21_06310 [Alkalicoccus urumqiensis]